MRVGTATRRSGGTPNIYHRLMDMEWDTPIGEVAACHGDAMMRVAFLPRRRSVRRASDRGRGA